MMRIKFAAFLLLALTLLEKPVLAQDKKVVKVYVMLAEECPICNYMGTSLSRTGRDYANKVTFYAVFPTKTSTQKTAARFKQRHNLANYATILDGNKTLTKKLGASVTPEVIIMGENDVVLYRGRINDAYTEPGRRNNRPMNNEMRAGIESALAGNAIPDPWPEAIGCAITQNDD